MAADYNYFYVQINKKINKLLSSPTDEAIKNSIKRNVASIRSWLPATEEGYDPAKNRLDKPAREALETALAILNAIEKIASRTYYRPTTEVPGSKSLVSHIFSGAHIRIKDNGALLGNLKKQMNLVDRYSSHYRDQKIALFKAQQENVIKYTTPEALEKAAIDDFNQGKPDSSVRAEVIFNELLMGQVTENGETYTWLQFEGHSHQPRSAYKNALVQLLDNLLQKINYSIEKFLHHLDFVAYRFHGKKLNIGQYGNSEFTESNPLTLEPLPTQAP